MFLFIDFCTCNWILPWLLPFLLGLLLGWLIWGRLRNVIRQLENENAKLLNQISELESELKECRAKNAGIDSEIALLKGRIRELSESGQSTGDTGSALGLISDSETDDDGRGGIDIDGDGEVDIEGDLIAGDTDGDDSTGSTDSSGDLTSAVGGATALGAMSSGLSDTQGKSSKNIYAGLKPDNLQIVEGIGPKMNEILNDHGVSTWAELASKSNDDIRAILDSVNAKRYRIIDCSSWPSQARLAVNGQWDNLISLQKNLDSGRAAGATGETDSKVEKLLIKMGVLKRWKQDDLTAVEGIGPKISQLLQNEGITSWRQLANTEVSKIQSILDIAGKRYKLADPGSWPKQAEMAADGRWDDLEEYQDFLQGGK